MFFNYPQKFRKTFSRNRSKITSSLLGKELERKIIIYLSSRSRSVATRIVKVVKNIKFSTLFQSGVKENSRLEKLFY